MKGFERLGLVAGRVTSESAKTVYHELTWFVSAIVTVVSNCIYYVLARKREPQTPSSRTPRPDVRSPLPPTNNTPFVSNRPVSRHRAKQKDRYNLIAERVIAQSNAESVSHSLGTQDSTLSERSPSVHGSSAVELDFRTSAANSWFSAFSIYACSVMSSLLQPLKSICSRKLNGSKMHHSASIPASVQSSESNLPTLEPLVHEYQKITTGFFEDISTTWMLFLDDLGTAVTQLFKFRPDKFVRILWKAAKRFSPKYLLSTEHLDASTIRDIIVREGYPYECYEVVTADGYILELERIPNRKASQVCYFQHGVIDASYAWIATGSVGSIAFRMFDSGYDVWLGNLRGTGKRRHIRADIRPSEYWDFNINHHAFHDVRSFIDKIEEVKRQELVTSPDERRGGASSPTLETGMSRNTKVPRHRRTRSKAWNDATGSARTSSPSSALFVSHKAGSSSSASASSKVPKFQIFAVAHSMGAAAMLMYLVQMRIWSQPHRLSGLVLMSPAGYHATYPTFLRVLGPLFDVLTHFFNAFRFPSDVWRIFAAKITQDVRNHPGARKLMSVLTAKFLLGGDESKAAVTTVHNLAYNTLNGTSTGVYRHFRQMAAAKRFQTYDYGAKRNLQMYGTSRPLDILANYHAIDVPVAYGCGAMDTLIPASMVYVQYEKLRQYHPDLAFFRRFERAGHVDFTLRADDEIVSFVFDSLDRFSKMGQANVTHV